MQLKHLFCFNLEAIENFEKAKADNFKNWVIHHRLETHNSDGELRSTFLTKEELIELDMYYHRPAEELIFMTRGQHQKLHHTNKTVSNETREKLSKALKCNKNSKGFSTPRQSIPEYNTQEYNSAIQKGKHHNMTKKHWRKENGKKVWY